MLSAKTNAESLLGSPPDYPMEGPISDAAVEQTVIRAVHFSSLAAVAVATTVRCVTVYVGVVSGAVVS